MIVRWIGNQRPRTAEREAAHLLSRCKSLSEWPERHPVYLNAANGAVRRCVEKPWLIFYRLEADRIMVLRILHAARDPEAAGLGEL